MPEYKTIKEEPNIIDFNEKAIQAYCDRMIERWREKKDSAINKKNEEDILIAECYIDAYQSMRVTLFGQLLPRKKRKKY